MVSYLLNPYTLHPLHFISCLSLILSIFSTFSINPLCQHIRTKQLLKTSFQPHLYAPHPFPPHPPTSSPLTGDMVPSYLRLRHECLPRGQRSKFRCHVSRTNLYGEGNQSIDGHTTNPLILSVVYSSPFTSYPILKIAKHKPCTHYIPSQHILSTHPLYLSSQHTHSSYPLTTLTTYPLNPRLGPGRSYVRISRCQVPS